MLCFSYAMGSFVSHSRKKDACHVGGSRVGLAVGDSRVGLAAVVWVCFLRIKVREPSGLLQIGTY